VVSIFAGLALLLAAIGLYGLLAFQVTCRTREFGVRIALGALPRQVLTQVLSAGLRLLAGGVILGLAGALLLGRLLSTLLYRTPVFDPPVLGVVALLLCVITLIACWLPAWRATRVDPLIALRAE
jgi:ABC-type antimicrobial peptide transport system permease subunit